MASQVALESGHLKIHGEMGFDSALALLAQTRPLLSEGQGPLIIDLGEVGRVDSAGLALLIEWMRLARQAGRELSFTRLPAQMQAIAEASDLGEVLPLQTGPN
ncbi:MAG: STAS domain-containing protein [Thiohalomonadaceae bacterium]